MPAEIQPSCVLSKPRARKPARMRHLFYAATLATALPFPGLPGQFEKIASAAKGRVGVAAQLLEQRNHVSSSILWT